MQRQAHRRGGDSLQGYLFELDPPYEWQGQSVSLVRIVERGSEIAAFTAHGGVRIQYRMRLGQPYELDAFLLDAFGCEESNESWARHYYPDDRADQPPPQIQGNLRNRWPKLSEETRRIVRGVLADADRLMATDDDDDLDDDEVQRAILATLKRIEVKLC